jgi:hypothetical protein
MNKFRNFWENHKGKIIVGSVLIGTTAAVILIKKNVHFIKPADLGKVEDVFSWNFENLEEAVAKFKDVEDACIALGKGEAAMFGGAPQVADSVKYTVMYL